MEDVDNRTIIQKNPHSKQRLYSTWLEIHPQRNEDTHCQVWLLSPENQSHNEHHRSE